MNDIHETITNQIIEHMEMGTTPWNKEWAVVNKLPFNALTKKQYNGINVLTLWMSGFECMEFATYKQWQEMGAQVKKGEKGTPAVFFKPLKRTGDDGEEYSFALARQFTVFNAEQVTGYTPAEPPVLNVNPNVCHDIGYALNVSHGDGQPSYSPVLDRINMPEPTLFSSDGAYMSTYYHECVHATGHKSRLDRLTMAQFGTEDYANEELVAELGAVFLCARYGIPYQLENHASYLASWLKRLKDDKRLIFKAAAAAQKAVEYIDASVMMANQESELSMWGGV